jgi:hypothetical protein
MEMRKNHQGNLLSVIISQESENKLKIIRQIFENLLPGNRHESPEGSIDKIKIL